MGLHQHLQKEDSYILGTAGQLTRIPHPSWYRSPTGADHTPRTPYSQGDYPSKQRTPSLRLKKTRQLAWVTADRFVLWTQRPIDVPNGHVAPGQPLEDRR